MGKRADDACVATETDAPSTEPDLDTVNEESANTSGDGEWGGGDDDEVSNELRRRLGNLQGLGEKQLQPKSVQMFSMATPACSFAPAKAIGQIPDTLAESGLPPSHFCIATPAASFAPAQH